MRCEGDEGMQLPAEFGASWDLMAGLPAGLAGRERVARVKRQRGRVARVKRQNVETPELLPHARRRRQPVFRA